MHYHLRPGGIRRIIELATPHLLRAAPRPVQAVTLATGEAPERKWEGQFRESLAPVLVEFFVEPAFGYFSEQSSPPRVLQKRIIQALQALLDAGAPSNCLVWAHNLGVGRNLLLARELARACAQRGLLLVAHHHDLWFDNRWNRWPEMQCCGFHQLSRVAKPCCLRLEIGRAHV